MESEFLTAAELRQFGNTPSEQAETMKAQGLHFRQVGRRLLVSRYHLREWLAGRTTAPSRGPRLDLVQ